MKTDMMNNSDAKALQFNGDILKLIAAITMLTDHIGAILFPQVMFLRIIGRMAFPIFVFFIAEGCIYTRSKGKYLLNICVFAAITQMVKIIFKDTDDLNVLFTFAVSVIIITVFQAVADSICQKNKAKTVFMIFLFAVLISAVWLINKAVVIQYGFWGCIAPFIVCLARYITKDKNSLNTKLLLLVVAMTAVYMVYGGVQIYAYLAVMLLLCYSGKKGGKVPKYFFYIFYPSHLAVLYILQNIF